MRLVFAGTPEPAVVALQKLIDSDHEVVAVLTQPDARRGRGRTLHPSAVAELAQQHGIEVLKPTSLKADTEDGQAIRQRLAELAPDCLPVVAYGQLITKDLLDVAPHGWVNLHFSLLPAWRGAAPVQASIREGDQITGATTFRIDEGLDTGVILSTIEDTIQPTDTADDLLTRLAYSGGDLLVETMTGLEQGTITPRAQEGEATYASKITTQDAQIDWSKPAEVIDRHIRHIPQDLAHGPRLSTPPQGRAHQPLRRGRSSSGLGAWRHPGAKELRGGRNGHHTNCSGQYPTPGKENDECSRLGAWCPT